MLVNIRNCVILVAIACVFPNAYADNFTLVNKASFLTEYYSRGISQTQENPAPQLTSTVFHKSGALAGIIATRVEFFDNDEADAEVDLLMGFPKIGRQVFLPYWGNLLCLSEC